MNSSESWLGNSGSSYHPDRTPVVPGTGPQRLGDLPARRRVDSSGCETKVPSPRFGVPVENRPDFSVKVRRHIGAGRRTYKRAPERRDRYVVCASVCPRWRVLRGLRLRRLVEPAATTPLGSLPPCTGAPVDSAGPSPPTRVTSMATEGLDACPRAQVPSTPAHGPRSGITENRDPWIPCRMVVPHRTTGGTGVPEEGLGTLDLGRTVPGRVVLHLRVKSDLRLGRKAPSHLRTLGSRPL